MVRRHSVFKLHKRTRLTPRSSVLQFWKLNDGITMLYYWTMHASLCFNCLFVEQQIRNILSLIHLYLSSERIARWIAHSLDKPKVTGSRDFPPSVCVWWYSTCQWFLYFFLRTLQTCFFWIEVKWPFLYFSCANPWSRMSLNPLTYQLHSMFITAENMPCIHISSKC